MKTALVTLLLLASAATVSAQERKDAPVPEKIPSPPSEELPPPTVNVRTADNGDVVQEYRQGGKIFMVRVIPKHGKAYYLYDDDGNGRLDRIDGERSVTPAMWTIYEWD
ncbi:DUF2782 domain-containing protein [Arenimonas sp.]|uniref:DUF2782 domain-containing protein n=1 Tax=Arenimonas sp. TaxID=1872635 RepID=UPI0039E38856